MAEIKQDMPPPGGYTSVNWTRIPAKKFFTGYQMFAGYVGLFAFGFVTATYASKLFKIRRVEQRSSVNALYPLMMAERDREYLKQLRRNRDEEAELMKNVPGWKVGQLYDMPVFSDPVRGMTVPNYEEFYAHADPYYRNYRLDYALWK